MLALGLALVALAAAKPCPAADVNLKSLNKGDGRVSVTFRSQIDEELQVYWMTRDGEQHDVGILEPLGEVMHQSFEGHAFRVRRMLGEKEVVAETLLGRSTRQRVLVEACGAALAAQSEAPVSPRAAEFEDLLHAPDKPCEGPSHEWSCVRYLHEEDLRQRDPRDYGLQPGEVSKHREFKTVDESYISQIPQIPRVTDGPGYAKMSFTRPLHDALTDWYRERRNDSMKPHGVIPGGYTNNDKVLIDKVNLDEFPATHRAIVRELRDILQWWTGLRLKHTSTFGIRVYRRGSMLIDHVDRMDTHLASAVIQVDQKVDENGGWPLELLLANGTVAEVYTQPGEVILYEGAWLRHGRPMRFRGDEFANLFSHFSPLDWDGPRGADSKNRYYGVPADRLTTLPDLTGYSRSTDYAPLPDASSRAAKDEL